MTYKAGDKITPYSDKAVVGTIISREPPPRTTGIFHPYPILTAEFNNGTIARFYDNDYLVQCRVAKRVMCDICRNRIEHGEKSTLVRIEIWDGSIVWGESHINCN